jgi:hypothetical protein
VGERGEGRGERGEGRGERGERRGCKKYQVLVLAIFGVGMPVQNIFKEGHGK